MGKSKQNIRILYIYPGSLSTFMAKDIRLLQKHFQVKADFFPTKNKKLLPYYLLRQFIRYLFLIHQTEVFIIKFGGYWSLAPTLIAKLMGKKSLIITGGTDCVGFPSLAYGNFQNPGLAWFTKKSFQLASHIVALHPSMMQQDYRYDICIHQKQGLQFHIPGLKTPWSVIYNGYDAEFWQCNEKKIPKTFITVASGLGEERRRKLKGIDLILQIATRFPDYTFQIVGTEPQELPDAPKNVELVGKKNANELVNYYSKATYYLQLSISEGFPNSLCEAMLCECIPIVSHVASMPFIIGDSGYILDKNDLGLLESLIQRIAKEENATQGKQARHRIAENFTEHKRENELKHLIEQLI
jgi:hypothetical protein